ncbi:C39 family peptidase [Anaerocolumna jejuensis]|uniref:C39 family peptidase n=1 Tax=Anaerocolumna jejuensis TaxID=259063 RepID=UPI003F7B8BB2
MIIIGSITCSIINWLVIATMINCILMGVPIPTISKTNYPLTHIITSKNYIDIQKNFECSAYSTAYLMRHYGIQANGEDIYKIMPNKMNNGYVYPKGVVRLLKQQGFKATIRIGNITELKREVSKDTPVIVFIKVYKDKSYLHYVPVVGFDDEYFYIAESLKELINVKDMSYNRRVSIAEFKKLWNTSDFKMPLYKYAYITVSSNKKLEV